MVSLIIYYHSSRTSNLKQMLRLLQKRDNTNTIELILVCQDNNDPIYNDYGFIDIKHFNLNLDTYQKPKMCNFGVQQSSYDLVLLADSDRIFPLNYIHNFSVNAEKGKIYTLKNHIKLTKDYTDADVHSGMVDFSLDYRFPYQLSHHRKNMFSGNTLIYKSDYDKMGGMDEEYIGYGFADNDACFRANRANLTEIFLDGIEMHLYHPPTVCSGNELKENRDFWLGVNGIRFMLKWNSKFDNKALAMFRRIDPKVLPPHLLPHYQKVYNEFIRVSQSS